MTIAEVKGFEAVASTFYNPRTNTHTLVICTNLKLLKYLLFHEFTHIIDTELYAKGDKIKYAMLSGFTEYHVSQIELLQMLGAKSCESELTFSMKDPIVTFAGEKSVQSYLGMKYQHAIEIFNKSDFPRDVEMLKVAVGVLFNYYGLRSICEKYAVDYTQKEDNQIFLKYIPSQVFVAANALMHGYLSTDLIELSMKAYSSIVFPIIKQYKLK